MRFTGKKVYDNSKELYGDNGRCYGDINIIWKIGEFQSDVFTGYLGVGDSFVVETRKTEFHDGHYILKIVNNYIMESK